MIRENNESSAIEILAEVKRIAANVFARPVTEEDNFFDLGGDSVSAVALAIQLEESVGVALDPETIFEADNLSEFARTVTSVLINNQTHPGRRLN